MHNKILKTIKSVFINLEIILGNAIFYKILN